MIHYLARRLVQGVFVLLAAFTISFVILYMLPGNPVLLMLGGGNGATLSVPTQAQIIQIEAEYGFNKPIIVQYFIALGHALTGNFGASIQTGQNVTTMLAQAFVPTLQLALVALLIALVLGVGVALLATYTRIRILQQFLLTLPSIGVSMPTFWTGLVLIQVFSFHWSFFPALGNNGPRSLVLPAITLSLPTASVIAQLLAKSLRTTLIEPYIESARTRGISRARVLLRHALRTASIPALTMVGVIIGNLLAGSVVVETIFSRTGVGRVIFQAVDAEDIPVIQGVVVLSATIFVIVSLAVDVIYCWVDPRIAMAGRRSQ